MQSIFRLPWCSDQIVPKASDKAALEKMRPAPVVEIPVLSKFKRKRTNSPEPSPLSRAQPKKKPRPDALAPSQLPAPGHNAPAKPGNEQTSPLQTEAAPETPSLSSSTNVCVHLSPQAATSHESSSRPGPSVNILPQQERNSKAMANSEDVPMTDFLSPATDHPSGFSPLQQVIEQEFNMQILMKHNELRLIDQELAKCQVALEQLRRCEVRPFPGNNQPSESVSSGTGAAIAPPPGYTRPAHPAPYGVTDGPYSRHYRSWLLQDPHFDPISEQAFMCADGSAHAAGRSTRNSGSARKASKSFVFPGKTNDSLQSIPNYPTLPAKDKSAPLVLKRSTDGKLVKLICLYCQRGNFSSIQGFLNHCRIAHKREFKSHDQAAIESGQLLEENELASLPPENVSTPAVKPTPTRAVTASSTPNRNLVHPLNTTSGASLPLNRPQQARAVPRMAIPRLNSTTTTAASTPLTSSPQIPRLSAFFAKHQLGGDLAKAAAMAKQKVDLGLDDDMSSPDTPDQSSPLHPASGSRMVAGVRHPGSLTSPSDDDRPPSRKGFRQSAIQRPRPSPLTPMVGSQMNRGMIEFSQDQSPNLSPHAADSNPGLVSDHEDDDHGSVSEEEAPHATDIRPPLPVARNCSNNMEIDVEDGHDMDENGVVIRRDSMSGEDDRALHATRVSPSRKLGGVKRG